MKRLSFGIFLSLLGACTVGSPIATKDDGKGQQQQPSLEEQLRSDLTGWCASTCSRLEQCPDVSNTCFSDCKDYMGVMLDHGDPCVQVAANYETCLDGIQTCDEIQQAGQQCDGDLVSYCSGIGDTVDTTGPNGSTGSSGGSGPTGGPGATGGPTAGPVACDVQGTSAGSAGSANPAPMANQCDASFDNCSDGSSYRVICGDITGTLTCNCFKDGNISGSFAPQTGCPPQATEIDFRCGWGLEY
jgi:hypothetical protein